MSLASDFNAERCALRHAIDRCHNPKHPHYANYGGRGIRVCDEWRDIVRGFCRFFMHLGPRPSSRHSLDRIDNNRGYEPGNVRWATRSEQQNNRRPNPPKVVDLGRGIGYYIAKRKDGGTHRCSSPLIEHEGRTLTITEWSREIGLAPATIRQRIQRGWTAAQALSPVLLNPRGQPRRDQ